MSVIFGDRETEWSADSLALIFARMARPLEHSIRGIYPIPAIPCANPKCGNVRMRQQGKNGRWEGLTGAHDWCSPCTNRYYAAGRPETGPPDPAPERVAQPRKSGAQRRREARMRDRETAQPPVPRNPLRLIAGDYGYRPSAGTARREEAA